MKIIETSNHLRKSKQVFTNDDINRTFRGSASSTGSASRKVYLVAYSQVVDLKDPINTYTLPATFYDVEPVNVEVVVKS